MSSLSFAEKGIWAGHEVPSGVRLSDLYQVSLITNARIARTRYTTETLKIEVIIRIWTIIHELGWVNSVLQCSLFWNYKLPSAWVFHVTLDCAEKATIWSCVSSITLFKTLNRRVNKCIPVGKEAEEFGMKIITEVAHISNKVQVTNWWKLEGFMQFVEVRMLTQRGMAGKAFAWYNEHV